MIRRKLRTLGITSPRTPVSAGFILAVNVWLLSEASGQRQGFRAGA